MVICFLIGVVLVLINFIVALMNDEYEDVKKDAAIQWARMQVEMMCEIGHDQRLAKTKAVVRPCAEVFAICGCDCLHYNDETYQRFRKKIPLSDVREVGELYAIKEPSRCVNIDICDPFWVWKVLAPLGLAMLLVYSELGNTACVICIIFFSVAFALDILWRTGLNQKVVLKALKARIKSLRRGKTEKPQNSSQDLNDVSTTPRDRAWALRGGTRAKKTETRVTVGAQKSPKPAAVQPNSSANLKNNGGSRAACGQSGLTGGPRPPTNP